MKILLSVLTALLIANSAFAQNPNLDFKFALKGYNQTTYNNESGTFGDSYLSRQRLDLFQPVAGVQWLTKGHNSHEITLNYLGSHQYEHKNFSNTGPNGIPQLVGGRSGSFFDLSMTYEYQLLFNKQKETKLIPSMGFGLSPYFSLHKFTNHDALQQRHSTTTVGSKIQLTPRIQYFVSPKYFLDINVPFCLMDITSNTYKNLNTKGTYGNVDGVELPRVYQLRLGLGLKL